MHLTPLQRFERKYVVDDKSGCWQWRGAFDGDPRGGENPRGRYGRFALDGYHMMAAHRASFILFRGPIADERELLHNCDNPACVNPAHLVPGTTQENSDDKLAKGRSWHQRPGAQSPRFGTGVGRVVRGKGCVVDATCAICGAPMLQRITANRQGKTPVCSFACKIANNVRVQTTKVSVACAECGTFVLRKPSELRRKPVSFCSSRCVGKRNARNRWHPEQQQA